MTLSSLFDQHFSMELFFLGKPSDDSNFHPSSIMNPDYKRVKTMNFNAFLKIYLFRLDRENPGDSLKFYFSMVGQNVISEISKITSQSQGRTNAIISNLYQMFFGSKQQLKDISVQRSDFLPCVC